MNFLFIYVLTVPEDLGGSHGRCLVFSDAREHYSEWKYGPYFESLERRVWTVFTHTVRPHFYRPLHAFTWKQVSSFLLTFRLANWC